MRLEQEELVEQAFFFRTLRERMLEDHPLQEVLMGVKEEVLASTKLPMAIEFLHSELLLSGRLAGAMRQLAHYFTPFQTYLVTEAEDDRSRFDLRIGLEILEREAQYKATEPPRQGLFLYDFEVVCRNRLKYDEGLAAIAADPYFSEPWQRWILTVRRQIGIIDFADLLYVRSEYYRQRQESMGRTAEIAGDEVLFSDRDGRIALANRRKEPLYMLAAMQRQLGYPAVPRLARVRESTDLVPQLVRRIERLEARLNLIDEEAKGGIDLTRYYAQPNPPKEHE